MPDWNPSDTATMASLLAGVVFLLISLTGIITLILRNMGRRTDPELVGLLKDQMQLQRDINQAHNDHKEVMAVAINRLADTLDQYKATDIQTVEALKAMLKNDMKNQDTTINAIQSIPDKVDEKQRVLVGKVTKQMTDTADEKSENVERLLRQVLAEMGEMKSSIDELKATNVATATGLSKLLQRWTDTAATVKSIQSSMETKESVITIGKEKADDKETTTGVNPDVTIGRVNPTAGSTPPG